jgi:hypothetical protein
MATPWLPASPLMPPGSPLPAATRIPPTSPAQAKYGGSGGKMISYFSDGFLAAIKPDGSGLVYSTYLGGQKDDGVINLTADSRCNV